jgi:hypothetical protein
MLRIFIGSLVAGLVQFIVGAIAWVSPLGALAFKSLGDVQTAQVQAALASGLTATGSGAERGLATGSAGSKSHSAATVGSQPLRRSR